MILNTDIEKVKVLYRLRYVIPLLLNSIKLAFSFAAITRNLETGCPIIVNCEKFGHSIFQG